MGSWSKTNLASVGKSIMLGAVPVSGSQTLKGHYSDFPSLKHFFPMSMGTQSAYKLVDVVGGIKLAALDWTETSSGAVVPDIDSEASFPTGHHNVDLDTGQWVQPDEKDCIWLICGKFNGNFSFGYGDSLAGPEVVFSQFTNPTAFVSGGIDIPGDTPSWFGFSEAQHDPSVTSMQGWFTIGADVGSGVNGLFITNPDGSYAEETELVTDENQARNFNPGTYSIGRKYDVARVGAESGIVDLSGIAVFVFENGMPGDYQEAIAWMRKEWSAGRKVIWPNWKNLT